METTSPRLLYSGSPFYFFLRHKMTGTHNLVVRTISTFPTIPCHVRGDIQTTAEHLLSSTVHVNPHLLVIQITKVDKYLILPQNSLPIWYWLFNWTVITGTLFSPKKHTCASHIRFTLSDNHYIKVYKCGKSCIHFSHHTPLPASIS